PVLPASFADHCRRPAGFDERYRQAFGEAIQGCRAVLAYDAVRAISAGLAALGPLTEVDLGLGLRGTRHRLRDAVAAADFKGLSGRVRFDAVGDRRTGAAVMEVASGDGGATRTRLRGWVGGR